MVRHVSEPAREREVFRYDPTLTTGVQYNHRSDPAATFDLATSDDTVLTALAQLGACRTKTSRSLISLFDQKYQYIIAEATPNLPLVPSLKRAECGAEDLWMCGTAIPRSHGICEDTLLLSPDSSCNSYTDLPVSIIDDLNKDPRLCNKPFCLPGSPARFYAAVPIRTVKGIHIGVYCVINDEPIVGDPAWKKSVTQVLYNISGAIMNYLETKRSKVAHRRSERMVRGIGSFVDNKSTLSDWRSGLNSAAFEDTPGEEGALNSVQQQAMQRTPDELTRDDLATSYVEEQPRTARRDADAGAPLRVRPVNQRQDSRRLDEIGNQHVSIEDIFSKAANIIRESVETEGVLFVDANTGSFGALVDKHKSGNLSSSSSPASTSSDEARSDPAYEDVHHSCRILGFSTTDISSINTDRASAGHDALPAKLLSTLLRRYPRGKIFNFDGDGVPQTSDSSESEQISPLSPTSGPKPSRTKQGSRSKNPFTRHLEGGVISSLFPGARSIAFVPVWDDKKERWFAGGFVYTQTPTRVFTPEGELSYLRAFNTLSMSEVHRLEATLTYKAQSDVLSSLSHELRSPLHGVILGVELLTDTPLDAFQVNILHTLETCGRTLLDTVDHLLDFSKVNNYVVAEKKCRRKARGLRSTGVVSVEAGMKSLYTDLRLDVVVEEVVESVFAGFNFQRLSVGQLIRQDTNKAHNDDTAANQKFDTMKAMEEMGPIPDKDGQLRLSNDEVLIHLDIEPGIVYHYCTMAGAIRRIVMNLFGNALKYTQRGAIRVSLCREPVNPKGRGSRRHMVRLVVADTGKGITEDYLHTDLYKPFSQEDQMNPGTGLGLSLVKKIVTSLSGEISIKSQVNAGTVAVVRLPLACAAPSSVDSVAADDNAEFEDQKRQLKGLRVRLIGLHEQGKTTHHDLASDYRPRDISPAENVCRDWLQMQTISESQAQTMAPDVVLCAEAALGESGLLDGQLTTRPPVVVICPNSLAAHHRAMAFHSMRGDRIYEFISQPTGPRKLAKILVLAFKRWIELQALPPSPTRSPSPTGNADRGPTAPALELSSYARPSSPEPEHLLPVMPSIALPPPMEFLLVDDNPVNLKILCAYMKKLGRKYTTACDGREAVDTFKANPDRFKCIFMDISMPRLDGMAATQKIRMHEREKDLKHCTIFALTGLASASAQQEAFESGIDLFLTKPVRLKEIDKILTTRGLT
ncbi:hypothetical protein BJ170DRAFT_683302 [Xylariales sp. AK1849]|nr:hypothetical protein BJ170DRAFT_683302 [Xylariales sp. AK1849]